jgi:NADH-quinone oxidoreductase subunit G
MVDAAAPSTLVTIKIDGVDVHVPAGANLIAAAKSVGIEIPHYCYHPDLSIAGNCRMCQIEVAGMPKLTIACNTVVKEGMEVRTHHSSQQVKDAQAATLEFILINHPLDCTVCDQAGHCKLQDYHYEYNARPSRFLEDKEHKVKAKPLGPTVNLDGERCISCTRCVRFCDEITQTSELGLVNRGDKSVITVNDDRPLENPLSGTVVDLCPVGALTHREWRFNTRIWFTAQTDSICPGCSTGCNVKIAERDGGVVLVKGRYNQHVNKEWLCNEGRYGMDRFLPEARVITPLRQGRASSWAEAKDYWKSFGKDGATLVLCSPDLTLEDYALVKEVCDAQCKEVQYVTQYRERSLTREEKVLVSPDYAPNFRGAQALGLTSNNCERVYLEALEGIRRGAFKNILVCGDNAIAGEDLDAPLVERIRAANTVACLVNSASPLIDVQVVVPIRSVLERSGLMINRGMRLQYLDRVVPFVESAQLVWRWFAMLSNGQGIYGSALSEHSTEREATLAVLAKCDKLYIRGREAKRYTIADIKGVGIDCSAVFLSNGA